MQRRRLRSSASIPLIVAALSCDALVACHTDADPALGDDGSVVRPEAGVVADGRGDASEDASGDGLDGGPATPAFKLLTSAYLSPWTGSDFQDSLTFYGLGEANVQGGTATSNSGQPIKLIGEWDWTYYGIRPGETIGDGTVRDNVDCYGGPAYPGCYTSGPADPAEGAARLASYIKNHTPALPPGGIYMSILGVSWLHHSSTFAGPQIIGSENGAGTGNFQSHLAFSRGAARQFGWEWVMDWSSWYGNSVTSTRAVGPAFCPTCGHSKSLMKRLFYLSWFGGANYIHDEGGGLDYFQELPKNPSGKFTLTAHGQVAKDFMDFTRAQDRGTPFVPVGVMLNRYHGIASQWSMGKTWEFLPWSNGDQDWWTYNIFNQVLWPSGFNNTVYSQSEDQDLVPRAGGWGDVIDVVTEDAPQAVLNQFDVLVLSGKIDWATVPKVNEFLRLGKRVVLSPGLQGMAPAFVPSPGQLYVPGDLSTFASHLRAAYEASSAPFIVSGSHVSYQIATRSDGSKLLALYNNRGVNKAINSTTAETLDASYNSVVTISKLKTPFSSVTKLLGPSAPTWDSSTVSVVVPAGDVVILKL